MWVLTVDQRGSRRVGDRVDELLDALDRHTPLRHPEQQPLRPQLAPPLQPLLRPLRPFERTVGDEVQAVLDDADLAVDVALTILRRGGWTVGIGAGPVDEPLPASTRAGSGEAFVLARSAVERAKSRPGGVPLAVAGTDPVAAADAEAVLTLLGAIAGRRTAAGWEVIDALSDTGSGARASARQEDVAGQLGITQQAVSQRLRTALWSEELAARPAAARLLRAAAAPPSGTPDHVTAVTGGTSRGSTPGSTRGSTRRATAPGRAHPGAGGAAAG